MLIGMFLTSTLALSQSPQASKKKVFRNDDSTAGRITKWTATGFIGDSAITEDGQGKVGIGATNPTSTLTVNGLIESRSGGIRFPDGTVQTTASGGVAISLPLILDGSRNNSLIFIRNNFNGNGAIGVSAEILSAGTALFGLSRGAGTGVGGSSIDGLGVFGVSTNSNGAVGSSVNANGVFGISTRDDGVRGQSFSTDPSKAAIFGVGKLGGAFAGRFTGNVAVSGTLSKAGGSFRIDHPLDPENRYLSHSFVESPDMKNIYDGNTVTDGNGDAVVELPAYFEALNRDFCYQLTVIGSFAQAIVAQEIKGNRFSIRTNAPNVKVSWQVTGIRQDAWANRNRIKIEENKSERERGHYLHPEAFDQPEERGVERARDAKPAQAEHRRNKADKARRIQR